MSGEALVGPESIPYRALVMRVAGMMENQITIGTIPLWIAKLGAALTSRVKGGGASPTVIDVVLAGQGVYKPYTPVNDRYDATLEDVRHLTLYVTMS